MYKAVITEFAKQDIRENAKWYNKQQKGLGKRFTNEVRKAIKHIKQNPENIQIRYKNVRAIKTDVFPYMLHFTIDEPNKTIIVKAVFSTHQNPNDWNSR